MQDKLDWFRNYMNRGSENLQQVGVICGLDVVDAAMLISKAFSAKNRLLLCGNGTSASLCQIMAARFTSRLTKVASPGRPAISLTENTAFITGHSRDFGIEEVYSRLVVALGHKGDLLMGIESGSQAENIEWAFRKAQYMGIPTISLTGEAGKLSKMATVSIKVPFKDPTAVDECHMAIQSAICYLVETILTEG